MTQENQIQFDSKKTRAYQRKKAKQETAEIKQFQQEAAIYLRVSSEMQKDGFSIDAQKLACEKCVADKGFHLSEEHTIDILAKSTPAILSMKREC